MNQICVGLWLSLVLVGFVTMGCAEPYAYAPPPPPPYGAAPPPYVEQRVIRQGPVIEQREVVK